MEHTAAGLFRILTGFPFHHGLFGLVNLCVAKIRFTPHPSKLGVKKTKKRPQSVYRRNMGSQQAFNKRRVTKRVMTSKPA